MRAFGPAMPQFSKLSPGVRRLVAPNPSMMTGPGTNTYLLGVREIAVLDPGPAIDKHIEMIVRQMLRKVRVVSPGDSEFLPAELVDEVFAAHIDPHALDVPRELEGRLVLGRDR